MLGVTRAGGITGTEWDWLVLQKQYDDSYSAKSNSIATSYQNAMTSYNTAISKWKQKHQINNNNTVFSSQIRQGLKLNREPNATISIRSNYSHQTGTLGPYISGKTEHDNIDGSQFVGTDSTNYAYVKASHSINGIVLSVTYNNLSNSYYTDDAGIRHQISKIIRTFSNLSRLSIAEQASGYWCGTDSALLIYNDPTDGWWLFNSDSVDVTEQFFDDNGNPIQFGDNAFLAMNSLDATYQNPEGTKYQLTGTPSHVEYAKAISGIKAIALAGSSIINHNGNLYANQTNDPVGTHGINDRSQTTASKIWDRHNSNDYYYGSGLFKLEGSSISYQTGFKNPYNQVHEFTDYIAPSTIIPVTPGPTPPPSPELISKKTAAVSYHSNTLILFFLIFSVNCIRVIRY